MEDRNCNWRQLDNSDVDTRRDIGAKGVKEVTSRSKMPPAVYLLGAIVGNSLKKAEHWSAVVLSIDVMS